MINHKPLFTIILLMLILLLVCPIAVSAAEPESVLILYHDAKTMEALIAITTASGAVPDAVRSSEAVPKHLNDYACIISRDPTVLPYLPDTDKPIILIGSGFDAVRDITVKTIAKTINAELTLNEMRQSKLIETPFDYITDYKGTPVGRIQLSGTDYPLAVMNDSVMLLPYFNQDDLSAFAAAKLLKTCLTSESAPKAYILIDEVYPFEDLDLLRRTANMFSQSGIPIICRVMPVYNNTDDPAFTRFVDTLLYMQSKGTSFVLHDPIISGEPNPDETPEDKIKQAVRAYRVAGIDILPFDRTPYEISPEFLASLKTDVQSELAFPIDTMIIFPVFSDDTAVRNAIELVNDARLTIDDYSDGAQHLYTGETDSASPNPTQDDIQSNAAEPTFGTLVKTSSRVFTVIIIVSAISILILIAVGYRLYMNKFIKKS